MSGDRPGVLGGVRRSIGGARSRLWRRLSTLELLFEREVVTGPSVPMSASRRVGLWRHGFTSRSGAMFGVAPGEYDRFVSDYRLELLDELGGKWGDLTDNKLVSTLLFGEFADYLPAVYGLVDGGDLRRGSPAVSAPPATPDDPSAGAVAWIDALLGVTDALVLKPVYGYGGDGLYVCRRTDDGSDDYLVNGERRSPASFEALVRDLDEYLVSAFVEQADYAAGMFPDATNTLRVLTLRDPRTDEPFVAGAVHRIGTVDSAPVDNWSRGGLSAEVHDDGTLSRGARWVSSAAELRRYATHPDTGARIEGVTVPGWTAIRERLLEMAETFRCLPRVGWDVVVTDDGFAVLELNTHPGIETLQVHRPLLDDPRRRRFYEHYART